MVVCGRGSETTQVFKVQPKIFAGGLGGEGRWREDEKQQN